MRTAPLIAVPPAQLERLAAGARLELPRGAAPRCAGEFECIATADGRGVPCETDGCFIWARTDADQDECPCCGVDHSAPAPRPRIINCGPPGPADPGPA